MNTQLRVLVRRNKFINFGAQVITLWGFIENIPIVHFTTQRLSIRSPNKFLFFYH